MTEQELVEKVARAMAPLMSDKPWHCECTANRGDDCDCGDAMLEERVDRYDDDLCRNEVRRYARAALSVIREALSEPSEAMKENAALHAMMTDWQDITEDDRVAITAIYRAMIAASPIGEK